jgi:hypothetical protein
MLLADAMTWGQLSVLATVLGVVIAGASYFSRQRVQVGPQPLRVKIDEAMHDQFAGKKDFDALTKHTTERHGQLFKAVEKSVKDAEEKLARAVHEINRDRAKTMEGLRQEFHAVRTELTDQGKEIAGLQTATDLQNQSLNGINSKLDRLIERKS